MRMGAVLPTVQPTWDEGRTVRAEGGGVTSCAVVGEGIGK